jgi:excisionase family DNA binding protein
VSDTASPWLTVKEAAAVAKCGAKLIYREVRAGRLRAARIGARRDLRIHRCWVDEWLEASATPVEVHPHRGAA